MSKREEVSGADARAANAAGITREAAIEFLTEAANYFENRPTYGEDRAHWSNVYNADNCRKIATMLGTEK